MMGINLFEIIAPEMYTTGNVREMTFLLDTCKYLARQFSMWFLVPSVYLKPDLENAVQLMEESN